ncbi:MAG: DUF58 domain-containing protein [Bacteroidetes bacterium]|nr:DUF58 domain-containing protein [Bacteroidota bacterium]
MKFIKSLYLSDRLFIAISALIGGFIVSYLWEPFFVINLILLGLLIAILGVDIFLLYQKKSMLNAKRKFEVLASLHSNHPITILLRNTSKISLQLEIIDEIPHQLEQRDFLLTTKLDAGKPKKVNYTILPQIRGEYEFGNLNIFLSTVIGLAKKREVLAQKAIVKVVPSIIEMKQQELMATKNLVFNAGENKAKKLGKSYEFDQLKPYVVGDDQRNINWKATSKLNDLMVNHYEDERSQQVYSIIDKGRNMKMPFGGLTLVDYAINATLAFSNIVLKKHDKAGLIAFSERIDTMLKADKSPRQLRKIQQALYNISYHYSEPNYELLGISIRKLIPNRSLIFLYTNFDTLESVHRAMPTLKILNRNHRLILVFFNNTELEEMRTEPAKTVLDIYNQTMAQKFIVEKQVIVKELNKHGITSILTNPNQLSANTINKYLELKHTGTF